MLVKTHFRTKKKVKKLLKIKQPKVTITQNPALILLRSFPLNTTLTRGMQREKIIKAKIKERKRKEINITSIHCLGVYSSWLQMAYT